MKVAGARRFSAARMSRWRRIVGSALRHLDDRIWLADSLLGQLRCVETLAEREYPDNFRREGLAVQRILQDACCAARVEFAGSSSAAVLDIVLEGGTVTGFAEGLGLAREKAHGRHWRPVLDFIIEFVLDVEGGLRDAA